MRSGERKDALDLDLGVRSIGVLDECRMPSSWAGGRAPDRERPSTMICVWSGGVELPYCGNPLDWRHRRLEGATAKKRFVTGPIRRLDITPSRF